MIIVKTPLRISFAGGGSDIPQFYKEHAGATISTAINKYIYISVNKNFHDKVRVSYSRTEIVDHHRELEHTRARECLKLLQIPTGIEIVTMADVPSEGTGLGSSSSFTVGLLKALYAYKGQAISEQELAEQACYIEIEALTEPIGKQDQFIASFGGIKFIKYFSDGHVQVEHVLTNSETLSKLENSLLLFYSGIQRPAGQVLKRQIDSIKSDNSVQSLKKMAEFAFLLKQDLEKGNLNNFGQVLHESWLLKQSLAAGITDPVINQIYEAARKNGALGGKILGAGGGGFLMLFAPLEKHEAIRRALSEFREMPVKFDPEGSKILVINKNIQ